jgi:hypothetical protein
MQVVRSVLTERRLQRLAVPSSANALQMGEYINWISKLQPQSPEVEEALRTFTEKTPARLARRVAAGDAGPAPKAGKEGSKKKGKK